MIAKVRVTSFAAAVLGALGLGAPAALAHPAATFPNACSILAGAHPQKALYPGKSVTVTAGKETTYASGVSCTQKVGSLTVTLGLVGQDYGFGGVLDPQQTPLTGMGGGTVITGKLTNGTRVATARFHRGSIWATLSVPGATVGALAQLSHAVYALLPR